MEDDPIDEQLEMLAEAIVDQFLKRSGLIKSEDENGEDKNTIIVKGASDIRREG